MRKHWNWWSRTDFASCPKHGMCPCGKTPRRRFNRIIAAMATRRTCSPGCGSLPARPCNGSTPQRLSGRRSGQTPALKSRRHGSWKYVILSAGSGSFWTGTCWLLWRRFWADVSSGKMNHLISTSPRYWEVFSIKSTKEQWWVLNETQT